MRSIVRYEIRAGRRVLEVSTSVLSSVVRHFEACKHSRVQRFRKVDFPPLLERRKADLSFLSPSPSGKNNAFSARIWNDHTTRLEGTGPRAPFTTQFCEQMASRGGSKQANLPARYESSRQIPTMNFRYCEYNECMDSPQTEISPCETRSHVEGTIEQKQKHFHKTDSSK